MSAGGNMIVVADRFVVSDHEDVIDLATGTPVWLVSGTAGGHSDEARWSSRCDRLLRLRQRHLAPLIDYGPFGEMKRFEAWRCDPWSGSPAEASRAVEEVRAFLRANGLTSEGIGPDCVRALNGRPVVVPDATAGYEADPASGSDVSCGGRAAGIVLIDRPAVHAVAELFAPPVAGHPRAVTLWAPAGAGMGTALQELARAARQQGFVPRSTRIANRAIDAALRGRSQFLIDRSGDPGAARAALLSATVDAPRPHVLLFAWRAELPGVPGMPLGRITAETLCAAIRPLSVSGAALRRAERCAQHANGLPGRFVRLLWHQRAAVPRHRFRKYALPLISIAAERPVAFAGVQSHPFAADRSAAHVEARAWPAPAELAALRRRLDAGVAALERGHHVPGERDVRGAAAGLVRRGDRSHAGQGYVALAASLLKRGRPREAQTLIVEARQTLEEQSPMLTELGVLAGRAALDLGRLDEAEHILHASVLGSEPVGAGVEARLALGRCLFWRGRYAEADRCVERLRGGQVSAAQQVWIAAMASRIAVGRRDLGAAVARAGEAVRAAGERPDAALGAHAAGAAAFAHLSVGDVDAVATDVASCVRHARLAHDPLRALRARLLAAESDRRAGRPRAATALLSRVLRLSISKVPPIVRARCGLLRDLLSASAVDDTVRRHIAASGLEALALFAPSTDSSAPGLTAAVGEVLEILRFCQTSEDDGAVLTRICTRLRDRLRAAGVAFFIADGAAITVAACDGTRIDPHIASRVGDTGLTIAPHAREGAIEAGAPVRLSGDIVGMLTARWTLAGMSDAAGAGVMLTMAAAAAAPAVAAVLSHRRQRAPVSGDLLGVSAGIDAVRQQVERAAAVPFAVLIEGESGSGKELVARALHRRSPRRDKPFCTLNCAALPDDLVEAELFGHARGAFTGAVAERAGVFEEAHTGTLFLDEIGELSPRAQAKLLRTIQEGEVRRVGENVSRRVDVRLVAATNRHLQQEVQAGRFRLDLFYRLDVLRVSIPPLRDRREDVAVLVDQIWRDAAARVASRAVLATATIAALSRYDWPGNVRELQNVLAALVVRSPRRGVVPPTALPPCFAAQQPADTWKLDTARRTFEERFVRAALVRTGGHRGRAAEELGVTRQGLTKLMARLGIQDHAAS